MLKGDIVIGANGHAARIRRIKSYDDKPDEIVLESLTHVDKEGEPLELDGRYTLADFKTGRLRLKRETV